MRTGTIQCAGRIGTNEFPLQGKENRVMESIEIKDLNKDTPMTDEEIQHVKGGSGLLLPAVQKLRSGIDSTTQKIPGDGSVRPAGDPLPTTPIG